MHRLKEFMAPHLAVLYGGENLDPEGEKYVKGVVVELLPEFLERSELIQRHLQRYLPNSPFEASTPITSKPLTIEHQPGDPWRRVIPPEEE